ncbi:cobalt ABC transporter [Williamsia sp. 1138]|uniref:energy-coupling factor transporter transmembrane component T family protein n=1 Tax=Williamsia sp. 1138 TaxID=1903117 RepID=UPI000A109D94|nr:energy-coupling factor transporter transmembrane protein EcfT [Williamsia sp. 1138]OZG27278.1 cobalt ABC transporter [Williamsia sp. 1138]
MSVLGIYRPGRSLVHRLPAGVKLLLLAVTILVMALLVTGPLRLAVAALAVAGVYVLAAIGPRVALEQLRPLVWVVGFVFVFQIVFTDWARAVVVCGVLVLSVALAAVVTLTTKTTAMLAALTTMLSPLSRIGMRPSQIALAMALAIRAIPLMVEIIALVDEARRARGLRFSPRVVVAPAVIATLHAADGFAESLTARGLD